MKKHAENVSVNNTKAIVPDYVYDGNASLKSIKEDPLKKKIYRMGFEIFYPTIYAQHILENLIDYLSGNDNKGRGHIFDFASVQAALSKGPDEKEQNRYGWLDKGNGTYAVYAKAPVHVSRERNTELTGYPLEDCMVIVYLATPNAKFNRGRCVVKSIYKAKMSAEDLTKVNNLKLQAYEEAQERKG